MKNNASLIYNICLVIGDFLALIAAFVVAFILRVSLSSVPVTHPITARTYLGIFILVLPFWILIFALLGLYSQRIYEKRFVELGRLFIGSFVGLLFVIFINFLSSTPIFPAKLVPVYGFGLGFILLVVFRNVARLVRTELFSFTVGLNNVVLVGDNQTTTQLINMLMPSRNSGYNIVGVIGSKTILGEHTALPLYESFEQALKHMKHVPHTIIQTELYADENQNREMLEYAQTHHVAFRFVPGNTELFVGNIDVELFQGSVPVIAVNQTALIGWGRIVKRLFDTGLSLLFLVIASPFMLVIAVVNQMACGAVFFRQNRLTRYNKVFKVYKFQTQYTKYNGTTPEEAFALMGKPELAIDYRANGDFLIDDPRVTRFGKFLRKTSLDELPQLFNVLRGEISLVGPRALIPQELSQYEKRHTILAVKSGLTGLAQVSGRRDISYDERRKLDVYYVQNWSFWLDVSILIKTIRAVLDGSGAR
jgi:exopolysaccharide biosynthesis polyprenyl glycosylphosphotransferase